MRMHVRNRVPECVSPTPSVRVCECVRVCGRIGSEPINGNFRARYLNHFIGLTLYCFFARCERVERKIYNCNLSSLVEARLKVCNDFDTRPWGRGIRRIAKALQCCGSLAHYEFLCTALWESCISMCACVCVCATALALQNMRCSTKNPIQLIFKCALRTRQDIGIHYLSILHMAKKGSDYKKQWEAKPRNAESAESWIWSRRWGRPMGGHAYYSLDATVGQWTMGWAIAGSLALAYLKCVPCAIQFPRILQRHLPNSAPLAKTRPRHRHRDRHRRVQHEKKRRQWQRHRGASIHPGAKRQPCIICIAHWGRVEQEQS